MIQKNRVQENRNLWVEIVSHVVYIAVGHGLFSIIAALAFHLNWLTVALVAGLVLVLSIGVYVSMRLCSIVKTHVPQLGGDWIATKNVKGKPVELRLHLDQVFVFIKGLLECVTNGRTYTVQLRLEQSALTGTYRPINDGCVEPGTLTFNVALDGQSLTGHIESVICNSDAIPRGKYVFKRV